MLTTGRGHFCLQLEQENVLRPDVDTVGFDATPMLRSFRRTRPRP